MHVDVAAAWQRQPLVLTAEPACSPTGRPYSPYPYRHLPKTPGEREVRIPQPAPLPAAAGRGEDFHLFSYLPTELRLQIWREAMLSACAYGRVLRIRLAKADVTEPDGLPQLPRLEIVATHHLSRSTHSTRSLLSACSEARHEGLTSLVTLPDTLALRGGGILRCNLARDIILLDDLSWGLLTAVTSNAARLNCHYPDPFTGMLLSATRHLGLDLTPLLEAAEPEGGFSLPVVGSAVISPQLETTLVQFVASFSRVEQVYLLQGTAITTASITPTDGGRSDEQGQGQPPIFLGSDQHQPQSQTKPPDHPPTPNQSPNRHGQTPSRVVTQQGEWYTTAPPPSYHVPPRSYYPRLARLTRVLCQLREALDAPAVVTDVMDREGVVERLAGVRVRLLGRYVATATAAAGAAAGNSGNKTQNGIAGAFLLEGADGEAETEAEAEAEDDWEPSSPERCLEIALGSEPRWVQWEWVCQCLDC